MNAASTFQPPTACGTLLMTQSTRLQTNAAIASQWCTTSLTCCTQPQILHANTLPTDGVHKPPTLPAFYSHYTSWYLRLRTGRLCWCISLRTESRNCSKTYCNILLLKFYETNKILTHTRLMALFPGLPRWAGTRKVKPIWILLKQETVSGSCISWAVCKSAPRSRQITMPAPHHSVFLQGMPFMPT